MKFKTKFSISFLIFLMLIPLPLTFADETVTDNFTDETLISDYWQIFVNTTEGHVTLAENDQPLDPSGLVLWFHMNEGSGTDIEDFSGEDNDGTLFGDTDEWVTGYYGEGIEFDGYDDYISVGDDDSLTTGSGFTWEVWLYLTKTGWGSGQEWATIWTKNYFNREYWFAIIGDRRIHLRLEGGAFQGYSSDTISLNAWCHVVVTWDGSTVRYYIDGVKDTDEDAYAGSLSNTIYPIYFGRMGVNLYNYKGIMDEPRQYSRAINQSEVTFSYESGIADHGTLYSTNLLQSLNVTEIREFTYDASITGSETIELQFSQDNSTWYNSTHLNGWESLSDGTDTINLRILDWDGGFIFYRVHLHKDAYSPELNSISLAYSTVTIMGFTIAAVLIGTFIGVPILLVFAKRRR